MIAATLLQCPRHLDIISELGGGEVEEIPQLAAAAAGQPTRIQYGST